MTSYDPDARRDTPLAQKLKQEIRKHGPIGIGTYMNACLWDQDYGYYTKGEVIGEKGDFTTAPEISQTFGEIVGAWVAVVWQQMGSPSSFRLVELGPGHGTLCADMARTLYRVPELSGALEVELMEASTALTELQRTTLADSGLNVSWRNNFPEPDERPTIIVANEFLDCLPPVQFVKTAETWRYRGVGLDRSGNLEFDVAARTDPRPDIEKLFPDADIGRIAETTATNHLIEVIENIARQSPTAALFIDYGHTERALGETLQAIRNQNYEHPLTSPGEADLTVHVDFSEISRDVEQFGADLAVDGPITQAEFLGRLGIIERASRLMSTNPVKAAAIEAGVMRLISPQGMGGRFKAIGVRSKDLPALPGFE